MANVSQLIDDLDGSTGLVETRKFSFEGQDYEIDLSDENYEALLQELEPFIEKARQVKVKPQVVIVSRSTRENHAIREWGKENGWTLSERGRLPGALVYQYNQAHNSSSKNGKAS